MMVRALLIVKSDEQIELAYLLVKIRRLRNALRKCQSCEAPVHECLFECEQVPGLTYLPFAEKRVDQVHQTISSPWHFASQQRHGCSDRRDCICREPTQDIAEALAIACVLKQRLAVIATRDYVLETQS